MKYNKISHRSLSALQAAGACGVKLGCSLIALAALMFVAPAHAQAPAEVPAANVAESTASKPAAPAGNPTTLPQPAVQVDAVKATASTAKSPWKVEVVDDEKISDVGMQSSLVVDKQGNLHVVFMDATHHGLRYGFRGRGDKRWFIIAPTPKGVAGYPSLAVDSQGHPHICFVGTPNREERDSDQTLVYMYFDGTKWSKQTLDTDGVGYFTSIQVDSQNHPRISYYNYHHEGKYAMHLKYAYTDGKQWYIQTVDRRMSTGKYNALSLDPAGNPHIAYTHHGLGDLLYTYWDGSKWEFANPDSHRTENHYVGLGASIVTDSTGHAHIAYFDATNSSVKYAWSDKNSWHTEIVSTLAAHGELDHVSLKLDSHGQPHLAFYDSGAGLLNYAVRSDKGWQIEVVDNDGNVGFSPSLALAPDDQPYISYYDVTDHALRLAHRIPGAPLPPVKVAEKKPDQKAAPKKLDADPAVKNN